MHNDITAELKQAGLIVKHNHDKDWHMNKFHFHDYYEINLVLTNNIKFFVGNRIYSADAGALFVFNNHDLHRSVSPLNTLHERYVLYFSRDFMQSLSTDQTNILECFMHRTPEFVHYRQLTPALISEILLLITEAQLIASTTAYGHDIHRKLTLGRILLLVNSLFYTIRPTFPLHRDPRMQQIEPLLNYVEDNLAADLSLDRLSALFYISKYHLGTVFKKATGFTVNEYVIYRRVLRARELLMRRNTVQEVGELVGFKDYSHFIRTFKRLVGISPKQYQLRR